MVKDKEYYRQLLSNANVVAYLNAISSVEAPTYYTAQGGLVHVPSSSAHPDTIFSGGVSAAFGRYQFMPNTWNGTILPAIGPLDIREPRDQDIAAIYLLDYRGTLNDVIAGNCLATLDNNSYEWASLPDSSSNFRYGGQGSKYDAQGFCNLVNSLKGTTLPKGPVVNDNSPTANTEASSSSNSLSPYSSANFSDINCPPIKEEDLYRANFQITNPGCKITGPIQPITGPSTNGGTVRASNPTNNSVGFSVNAQGTAQCSTLRNPMKEYTVSSSYGWRWGRLHAGTDLAAPIGTPVYAASNGKVDFTGWDEGGYGNWVIIISPENIETRYAHLDKIKCSVGQTVTVGQQIGDCGTTGRSTGPHLHFEIRIGGNPIDPQSCMTF